MLGSSQHITALESLPNLSISPVLIASREINLLSILETHWKILNDKLGNLNFMVINICRELDILQHPAVMCFSTSYAEQDPKEELVDEESIKEYKSTTD